MSPDPLMVNVSADSCCQMEADGRYGYEPPVASSVQERSARWPWVVIRSKVAVATLEVSLLAPAAKYSGEVTNSPICTVWECR